MNTHEMVTRSKKKVADEKPEIYDSDSEVDENGNLKGFIDYECDEDFDQEELQKQLNSLSRNSEFYPLETKKKKKKRKKGKREVRSVPDNAGDMFMSYLILKATEKANQELKRRRIKKNKKRSPVKKVDVVEINIDNNVPELTINDLMDDNLSSTDSSYKGEEDSLEEDVSLDEDVTLDEDEVSLEDLEEEDELEEDDEEDEEEDDEEDELDGSDEEEQELEEEDEGDLRYLIRNSKSKEIDIDKAVRLDDESESESEYEYEYDELDMKYEELIEKNMSLNSDESNMEFYHYLPKEKKEKYLKDTQDIYKINESNVPLRFKIIQSDMDLKTKGIAIENLDKMIDMDISTGEYSKMDHWINGLIKIPFGKYSNLPITSESSDGEKKDFIMNTSKTLDDAIYGHKEAKTHILQVIGKWIKNPNSGGNVLAIQGPMGNGKTTLVKDGISKVLNRPFAFIALGGASDSAFFDGHPYTYEGSHWGRIVQILQDSKCMNPVIYFDELDKISDTSKGDEIIHMLTHITDPSQNNLFQDNYFPGIDIDLSKVLFIFSYNDENLVNKILKDRMYVINTKGFKMEEKLEIAKNYLIPDIYNTFMYQKEDIIITDEIMKYIITNFTENEEGVRNLKRCIETIISKLNIHILSQGEDLSFKIDIDSLPIKLDTNHIDILLQKKKNDERPFGMYC